MYTVRDQMSRKTNGENMVRVVLLALCFFVLLQLCTGERVKEEIKDSGKQLPFA
jgi:hypothetical protein